jgi:hypothetical protein
MSPQIYVELLHDAAWLWLVLDMCLRMGEGSASRVSWGDGLGKGDLGRLQAISFTPVRIVADRIQSA